jgi:hypothetical protein
MSVLRATLRRFLDELNGDWRAAALRTYEQMKRQPDFREAVPEELAESMSRRTDLWLVFEELYERYGDEAQAVRDIRQQIDPRENPTRAQELSRDAQRAFISAYDEAVRREARAWRTARGLPPELDDEEGSDRG